MHKLKKPRFKIAKLDIAQFLVPALFSAYLLTIAVHYDS